ELEGDILILGVGGKVGPSLAIMAKRAIDEAGLSKKVIGVSRFSTGNLKQRLEEAGVETIVADLLKEEELNNLPEVKNVIHMVGHKFGTTGNEYYTWGVNAYLSGRVAEKFKDSNIIVFSTGNVYPLIELNSGRASENNNTGPIGEYTQSCLARERIFEDFSYKNETPMVMFRLSYAVELRYGILLEIAKSVKNEEPINLEMGFVNVIWQGDVCERALRALFYCNKPPELLNITGPEMISVRWLAETFGELFDKSPKLVGEEKNTALLNNAVK